MDLLFKSTPLLLVSKNLHFMTPTQVTNPLSGPDVLLHVSNWSQNFYQCFTPYKTLEINVLY